MKLNNPVMGSPYYQADFPGRLRRRAAEASARRRAVLFLDKHE